MYETHIHHSSLPPPSYLHQLPLYGTCHTIAMILLPWNCYHGTVTMVLLPWYLLVYLCSNEEATEIRIKLAHSK